MTTEQRAVGGVGLALACALVLGWALLVQGPAEAEPAPLELADRHFDAAEYDDALGHYLTVLETRPGHTRALARAAWIAFEAGDAESAARLVSESLRRDPDDPDALWLLAHIRLDGLDDPAGAVRALKRLLDHDDLSGDARQDVERLLDRATSA